MSDETGHGDYVTSPRCCEGGLNTACSGDERKGRYICSICRSDTWAIQGPSRSTATQEHHDPEHYRGKSLEPIDAIRSWLGDVAFVQYCRGQVIRYAGRLGDKDESVKEARKLEVYARWMRETLEGKGLTK